MTLARREPWGYILYDPELDEFEAHVGDGASELTIDRPISAGCLVTGKCNLGCKYCYGNEESLPAQEMNATEWTAVFLRLRSWGLMRVDLSGGEPTLRRDIGEIAQNALDLGLAVVLSTNGLVLRGELWNRLPPGIRIHVSFDSGFPNVHGGSRVRRDERPSTEAFEKTTMFVATALARGYTVRVLTCVGRHNQEGLFELGEHLAFLGVTEWNISRILPAGRAQAAYEERWRLDDALLIEQVHNMRPAFPYLRIRYSSRTELDGYFLLVLPDGTLATQYTDGRDKVQLGPVMEMSLADLQSHSGFNMSKHARKWIASTVEGSSGVEVLAA